MTTRKFCRVFRRDFSATQGVFIKNFLKIVYGRHTYELYLELDAWGIPGLPFYPESMNSVANSETCIHRAALVDSG